jgi:hypothetical protein
MATEAELRAALTWATDQQPAADKNVWEWLWEAIQGDFNDNRSTGQIAFDAAVSIIPVVDQICDVRDQDSSDTWTWLALVLTLVGLFPSLGSVVKGVLKIFFAFTRKYGLNHLLKALDSAMTWVITFLRKREVQKLLRSYQVDEVFKWLAQQVKSLRGKVTTTALLQAFDRAINAMRALLEKVTWLPTVGKKAQAAIDAVQRVRSLADRHVGQVLKPLQDILDKIAHRLEMESLVQRSGILDAKNVHFRGVLPEARAVTLMRNAEPPPSWLSKGRQGVWSEMDLAKGKGLVQRKVADGWPQLSDTNIKSFHTMAALEIKGPARLYRVVSPSNGAMGDCWIPEEVWKKITASPDPKAAWRKYLAVWPDWNPNGQFVVLEVPAGQTLKAWSGPASSQTKKELANRHLEGGWEQVIFKPNPNEFDTTRYYMRGGGNGETLHPPGLTRAEYQKLSPAKQKAYTAMRERINHPNIKGPLETGWGSTDFDAQLRDTKIGLPALPGQVTN